MKISDFPRSICRVIPKISVIFPKLAVQSYFSNKLHIHSNSLGDDQLGGWGGGWQIWPGQIIYFHRGLGWKIHFQVNQGQDIYFRPKKKGGGGVVVVRGFRRGCRTWISMFSITFCRLIVRNKAYLVAGMFWYCLFFSFYVYYRI